MVVLLAKPVPCTYVNWRVLVPSASCPVGRSNISILMLNGVGDWKNSVHAGTVVF